MNYLKPTELKRDELIRLVKCYERHGVTSANICKNGEMTVLNRTETGWTAQKGDVLKILKRTKRGWWLGTRDSDQFSGESLLRAAA